MSQLTAAVITGLVAAAGYALFRWLLARSQWVLLATSEASSET